MTTAMADKQQQFRAKHFDPAAQRWKVGIDQRLYFDLDQAARMLAQVHPTVPPRFGLRTAHEGLIRAVEQGYKGTDRAKVDPEAVAFYRQKLIELEVFEEESGGEE